ncbi:MAG: tyrosine-type recombinase/integrase [Thermoguttaceae bacterium]
MFPHASGRWCKKVKGRFVYFGKVDDDPQGQRAIELWLEQKDDLLAGRTPRVKPEGLILRELLDRYMVSKRHLLDTREISPKHFAELYACCRRIGDAFGLNRLVVDLAADDFDRLRKAISKNWGPIRLGNEVQRVRSVFKFGYESGLIDRPVRFGPMFKKPTRKVLRLNRAKAGVRMFESNELRRIIAAASQPMKAMILSGINCGFGNSDVANLPIKALNLKTGWVDYPRPKTGIPRRCPLWPETVTAIKESLEQRPKAKGADEAGLVFITKYGHRWEKVGVSEPDPETGKIAITNNNPVTQEFRKLLKKLKLHHRGLGFYTLRHVFETVAGGSLDQVSVNEIMGHVDDTIAGNYRERIEDARLKAVTDHVHAWLFENEETK